MGACKQSIIDLPDEDFTRLLSDDTEYQNWLDSMEREYERYNDSDSERIEGQQESGE